MSKFQIILLSVFGVFIVIAVAVFSLYRGASSKSITVTIWGDISLEDFSSLLQKNSVSSPDQNFTINYVPKPAASIEGEFTEALARGAGPDLIILTQDKIWKEKPKLMVIPYSSISERDFKVTFIEEAELFLSPGGIYALPFSIDPMVLYYNRNKLSAAGHARPIAYWDEIYAAATDLSKRDNAGNLVSSVISLGEAVNIPNAKDIFSLLLFQAGTPITAFVGSELHSQISARSNSASPGESALDFYTQFSNPGKAYYSWNRSLIDAQTYFTSGDSAYYLGFASEFRALKNKNPTLNFSVSAVPQSRVSDRTITFGRLRGIAISRGSTNPGAALTVATRLISKEAALTLSEILSLPPTRRDLLANRPTSATLSVLYDAALQSKGWLDPDTKATKAIFSEAIESVTSGRARTLEAIDNASREVDALIK